MGVDDVLCFGFVEDKVFVGYLGGGDIQQVIENILKFK